MPRAIAEERRLNIFDGSFNIACKLWRAEGVFTNEAPLKVVAYPGWLDNAGSYDTFAAAFVERCQAQLGVPAEVLAIDPPGCGRSDHVSKSASYNDVEESLVIIDCANVMGWEHFALVGHSRGGGVVAVAAGAFPDRILALVALDSDMSLSGMYPMMARKTAPQLLRAYWSRRAVNVTRKTRVFPDVDAAVEASVTHPIFPKTRETAENIVRRHLAPCEGGQTYIHDVRTYGQNQPLHITEHAMRQYMDAITAPCLLIMAARARKRFARVDPTHRATVQERHTHIKRLERTEVDGDHHVHSDQGGTVVGDVVLPWLARVLPEGDLNKRPAAAGRAKL